MSDHNPPRRLRVCTYNIHKGFSQFNRRMMVHELRQQLRSLDADVVFLQEVQGMHSGHHLRHTDWPEPPQHEFLAEQVWEQIAYGKNAVYDHGHHGNAILSRYPIVSSDNQDISDHRFESRGLLHCELSVPQFGSLHCVCVHLSLTSGSRERQMRALVERMLQLVPSDAPLIIAGDFNDWRNRADVSLAGRLGLTEVFYGEHGHPAKSFPSHRPLLCLDRIYVRHFRTVKAKVHSGRPWSQISDHAALSADLELE